MGFKKFTVSESVEVVQKEQQERINAFLKKANKSSVGELTDEEKQQLDTQLAQ